MHSSLLEINSPESLIIGIILLLGLYNLGKLLFYNKFLENFVNKEYHYCLFGLIFISIPIYLSSLYNLKLFLLYKIISLLIILSGVFQIICTIRNFNFFFIKKFFLNFFPISIVLFFLVLISFSPATNADSLDYHYGIATKILDLGYFPNPLELTWLHGYLAGIMEPVIALGLFLGSDSFGAVQQIIAISSISGSILEIKKNKILKKKKELSIYLILIFAITPLIFIFSSAKPQLIGVASSLLAIRIIFGINKREKANVINIFLILLLITFSYLVKFTFIISSSLIFFYLLYKCVKFYKFKALFLSTISTFISLILPVLIWKLDFLNFSFYETLFYPIPISKPGMSEFLYYLRGHTEFDLKFGGMNHLEKVTFLKVFPIFLLFPSGFEKVTTFLGVPILFLFLFNKSKNKEIFELKIFILILYIFTSILSPANTRYYLLIYYLGVFHLFVCGINSSSIFFKFFYPLLRFHLFVYLIILGYGVSQLSPGIFNNVLREKVQNENAIYYNIAKIVKNNLPQNSKIVNTFRSTSFFPFKQLRTDWGEKLDIEKDKEKVNFFLSKTIDFDPKYLVTSSEKNYFKILTQKCIILIYKRDNIKISTRNPFYKGKSFINLSIYEFTNLKECLIK